MSYIITMEIEDERFTVETNDVEKVCAIFLDAYEMDSSIYVIDGFTGEVLASVLGEELYLTTEWNLILNGFIALN